MSNCGDKFRLLRDGTSQAERLLAALQPAYVAVDERNLRDLTLFAKRLATVVVHNSPEQTAADQEVLIQNYQDWTPFFEHDPDLETFLNSPGRAEDFNRYLQRRGQKTEPQLALFLTFLQLWKIARDDMNQLTRRHLDFYYREVLQLKENPAVPDRAFIIPELARHLNTYTLPKGTLLKAGKDDKGVEVLFATERNLTLSHAQIASLQSIWQYGNCQTPQISTMSNSADGAGAAIETEDQSWKPFGESSRPAGQVGFCVTSPLLQLEGGKRDICIMLSLDGPLKPELINHAADLRFDLYLSGEKEWIAPEAQMERDHSVIVFDRDNLSEEVQQLVLTYINGVSDAAEIHNFVLDDPFVGYGDQVRDYGIGMRVAQRVIDCRTDCGGTFSHFDELAAVPYLGTDKLADMGYSLVRRIEHDTTLINLNNSNIYIYRTLAASQDPVVNYNQEALGDPIRTQWPAAKVIIRKVGNTEHFPYCYFEDLKIRNVQLEVTVTGLQNVLVQNEAAVLDPTKVLQPFGSRPKQRAHFYVGSREVFSKQLSALSLSWEWDGLDQIETAENGTDYRRFDKYYNINDATYPYLRNNTDFAVQAEILDGYGWRNLDDSLALFTQSNGTAVADTDDLGAAGSRSLMQLNTIGNFTGDAQDFVDVLSGIAADPQLEDYKAWDTDLERGFVRLTLSGADFGHFDFQNVYTNQILKNTRQIIKDDAASNPLPGEPYTPALKAVQLNYAATDLIDLMADTPGETGGQFFHLGPFGVGEVQMEANTPPPFLTDLKPGGQLCIGIADLGEVRSLSLLLQLLEGSEAPEVSNKPVYTWSYLHHNRWRALPEEYILADGTNGLVNSGIINLELPKAYSADNDLLQNGLHWLRLSIAGDPLGVPDFVGLHTQAVTAVFTDRGNDPLRLENPLPAESITKLKVSNAAVSSIYQPYASFGGKLVEEDNNYYTRVSERLRHKERAITIWDYEHLVLHHFPQVYKVKCLNHTGFRRKAQQTSTIYSEMLPGHVSVVVLSNVRNKNAVDPLKPRSSTALLEEISRFLQALNPAYVATGITEANNNGDKLHVINPTFEEIRVSFEVRFHPGYDKVVYADQLREEIRAFLSPWAYDSQAEINFGGKIHKSRILHFVEERPYVDFVTCFRMYHVTDDNGTAKIEEKDEAQATRAASILGSVSPVPASMLNPPVPDHDIQVIEDDACNCPDNLIVTTRTNLPPDDYPIR